MSRITGKGSFRGVPFLIEDDQTINGGRRLISHEYPLRNEGLVEDLGKKQRSYEVKCLVIGDDYLVQAENLIKALEGNGKGILKHPFWGEKEVCVDTYSNVSSSSALRVSRFVINFLPATVALAPETTDDTLFGVLDSYAKALDELAEEFGETVSEIASLIESSTDNGLYRLVNAALHFVESNIQHISRVIGVGKTVRKKLNAIKNRLALLMRQPQLLAKELQSLFSAATTPSVQGINSRQKLNSYQVALTVIGQPSRKAALTKTELQQEKIYKANPQARPSHLSQDLLVHSFEMSLHQLIKGSVLIEYGKAVAQSLNTPQSHTNSIALVAKSDIDRYLEELNQELEQFSLTLADSGFWNSYLSLNQLRLSLISDLRVRGQKLKSGRQISLRETAPALTVAFDHTGNGKNWQLLCDRNNIRHPLFVVGGQAIEVLDE